MEQHYWTIEEIKVIWEQFAQKLLTRLGKLDTIAEDIEEYHILLAKTETEADLNVDFEF